MDGLYRPIKSHRRVVEEYVTDPSNNKNKVPILEPINHTIIECNNDNDTDDKRGVLMIDDDDVRWWQVSRMSRKSVFFFFFVKDLLFCVFQTPDDYVHEFKGCQDLLFIQ